MLYLIQKVTQWSNTYYFYFFLGMFRWLDKTAMDYTNWGGRSPYENSFGIIQTEDGIWRTDNRWYNRPYICKTPKGETNITC